jgi:hypothetical protein
MGKVEYFLNVKNKNARQHLSELEETVSDLQVDILSAKKELSNIEAEAEKYKIILMDPKKFEAFQDSRT